MKRLVVDWTRCDGHGVCARLLPQAVTLDEWGFPVVGALVGVRGDDLRAVVAGCPRLALRVEG